MTQAHSLRSLNTDVVKVTLCQDLEELNLLIWTHPTTCKSSLSNFISFPQGGETPLHLACSNRLQMNAEMLLDHRSQIDLKNNVSR
jgi:ankyrin repeat protein